MSNQKNRNSRQSGDWPGELTQFGKIPPQAIEIEEAVLGALLLESSCYPNISGIISENSFYKPEHRVIFDAIASLYNSRKAIDIITITQYLRDTDKLEEIGGPLFVTQLTNRVAGASHVEYHARIVAEKYYQRELIKKANQIIASAYGDEDIDTLGNMWGQFGSELEDIFSVADCGTHIRQVLETTIREIEADCVAASQDKAPGIPIGFKSLETNTGGWRGGDMIVLAARPGVGKTSFALHFALNASKSGFWVNIFSLEMKKESLAKIVIAKESGVYRSNIRDGHLYESDWERINQAVAKLENLPIIFRDAVGMNINQISSVINRNRKNKRCDIAIIDYMQLVEPIDNKGYSKGNREQEVSKISRAIKKTALSNKIPVIALSQLNREAEGREPSLAHLRESGSIEQDADIICFLYREPDQEGIIRFMVAKHRDGSVGDTEIKANKDMTDFRDMTDDTFTPLPEHPPNRAYIDPSIPANENFENGDPF